MNDYDLRRIIAAMEIATTANFIVKSKNITTIINNYYDIYWKY